MDSAIRDFLAAHPAFAEARDDWPLDPVVPLLARLALTSALPPPQSMSSILGIVTRPDETVLFIEPTKPSGTIAHLLVGGRAEPGETPAETLRREVLEETGWRVRPARIIGFRHFRHLGPPDPRMADRPYPDFIQPVYAATAERFDEAGLRAAERPSGFVDISWALSVTDAQQRPLLEAAIRATASPGER